MADSNTNRIVWLDIARGICILLMVICHACGSANGRWSLFNGVTGVFFLVFFFVAAGFCFNSPKGLIEYIKRQFIKCLLPYMLITFVFLCVMILRHSVPGDGPVQKILNSGASLIWGLPKAFNIGRIQTVGVGPIWFLLCFFISTILFKIFEKSKYSGFMIITLAIVSSISQSFVVLPLTIQDSFIGCMFIWIGYIVKKKYSKLIDSLYDIKNYKLILLALGLCLGLVAFTYAGFAITRPINRFLDLGSNSYSILSLPGSLFGCTMTVAISVLISKTKSLKKFLAFCGKESFLILIMHDLDITMLRNWGGRSIAFMVFTLIMYPILAYIYRMTERKIRQCLSL